MEDNFKYYPPKPTPKTMGQDWMKSLISMGLFVFVFMFVFRWDYTLIVTVLLVLFIHEMGHMTLMKILKYEEHSILFLPLVTGISDKGGKDIHRIISLFAGPLPGLIIGSFLVIYGFNIDHVGIKSAGFAFLLLNLFNLLPYDPLDGGKLMDTLFGRDADIVKIIFLFIAIAIFILAIFASPFLGIFAVFLGLKVVSIFRTRKVRDLLLKDNGIDVEKTFEDLTDEEYWEIRKTYLSNVRKSPIDPNKFEPFLNEDILINQVKNVLVKPSDNTVSIPLKVVTIVLWIVSIAVPVWLMITYAFEIIE